MPHGRRIAFSGNLLLLKDPNDHALRAARTLSSIARRNNTLARFLDRAARVARAEAVDLGLFFESTTSTTTTTTTAEAPLPLDGVTLLVLSCVVEAAQFLLRAWYDPSLLSSSAATDHVIGAHSIGALPAAAAAVARDWDQLNALSVDCVRVAARLAHALRTRSRRIDIEAAAWHLQLKATSFEEAHLAITALNERNGLSPAHQLFIASQSPARIIVGGPPSLIHALPLACPSLSAQAEMLAPLDLAVHAGHLPPLPIASVLRNVAAAHLRAPIERPLKVAETLLSGSEEEPFTFGQLLEHAICHIALDRVYLSDELAAGEVTLLPMLDPLPGLTTFSPANMDPMPSSLDEDLDNSGSTEIAVIGMSGRFPGAADTPQERFRLDPRAAPWGCFLEKISEFDPFFFSITPREAVRMDPVHRLLLMVAYEALESAGITVDPDEKRLPRHVSTFVGQTLSDYCENLAHAGPDAYFVSSITRAFTSGRINYHLGLDGGASTIDTACSASATAVTTACTALVQGQCDVALAGGANVIMSPTVSLGLSQGGYLSASGPCKAFRVDADGYCRGEAVGLVVLKRMGDAIQDNDHILASISGYARVHSTGGPSIVQPYLPAQVAAYTEACHVADVSPDHISYVEAHGTGTAIGDTTEAKSLIAFFGQRRSEDPLAMGAVKANIGHGEAAAGISSIIKAIQILRTGSIPPQPTAASELAPVWLPLLVGANILPSSRARPLGNSKSSRHHVLVSSYDASGGNTSLVISEAPRDRPEKDGRGSAKLEWHVVACSGKTPRALRSNVRKLLDHLSKHPDVRISDLAYTLTARRAHHDHRMAWVVQDIAQLSRNISTMCDSDCPAPVRAAVCQGNASIFVFSGQGSSSTDIARDLYAGSAKFRQVIDDCRGFCHGFGFPDFIEALMPKETESGRHSSVIAQLASLAFGIALAELLHSWAVRPAVVVGHSLGEYAAMCTAGVLSVADAIYLVGHRAVLMERLLDDQSHGMLAIRASASYVTQALRTMPGGAGEVACMNGPQSCTFGGPREIIDRLRQDLDVPTVPLAVDYAFHTAQMDSLVEPYAEICRRIRLHSPRITVLSSTDGCILQPGEHVDQTYFVRHLRHAVQFQDAITAGAKLHPPQRCRWIEIGPDGACSRMIRECLPDSPQEVYSTCKRNVSSRHTLLTTLALLYKDGYGINWSALYADNQSSPRLLVLPSYSFDLQEYWLEHGTVAGSQNAAGKCAGDTQSQRISSALEQMEDVAGQVRRVVYSSRLSNPALQETCKSHLVAGTPMCPLSTIGDMAAMAAWHTQWRTFGDEVSHQALISKSMSVTSAIPWSEQSSGSLVQVTVQCGKGAYGDMELEIDLLRSSATEVIQVARCKMCRPRPDELDVILDSVKQISPRIEHVIHCANENGQILRGETIYRLFGGIVKYAARFQGLKTVYLAPPARPNIIEAVATVCLSPARPTEHFAANPYWTDPMLQLPGMLLNSGLTAASSRGVAFIVQGYERFCWHGWAGDGAQYTCYTQLRQTEKGDSATADIYVFHQSMPIASCKGMSLVKVPLHSIEEMIRRPFAATDNAPDHFLEAQTTLPSSSSSGQNIKAGASATVLARRLVTAAMEESGLGSVAVDPSIAFSSLDIDSLRAAAAISRVGKEVGMTLPITLLFNHSSFSDLLREAVSPRGSGRDTPRSELSEISGYGPKTEMESAAPEVRTAIAGNAVNHRSGVVPSTKAVLIHGRRSNMLPPLFMMPSGSGSAVDFIHFPALHGGRRMYAISSPFSGCEEDFTCTIEETIPSFLDAIRSVQPKGPYLLGGYSAGAIFALELVRQLDAEGEQIDALFILDFPATSQFLTAPMPKHDGLSAVHAKYGHFFAVNRLAHTSAVFGALHRYRPRPLPVSAQPQLALVIWATESPVVDFNEDEFQAVLAETPSEYHPMARWFIAPRDHFRGPCGWDQLLGVDVSVGYCHATHSELILLPPVTAHVVRMIDSSLERLSPKQCDGRT
ncbi:Polyketide synthase [Teratosphaeria destructans]|uniref:Polyketide synthase n=1 Tax=Teratosphaeria destructans TaxID=418781 RepID=A0A9W7W6T3_9PEZI|nr:Polyketide synthase [Teratosphaeria destructans]